MSKMKVVVFGGFLPVFLCYLSLRASAQITDPAEIEALGAVRKSLKDPIGYLGNWKGDPCTSNWTGVLCFNTTLDDGYLHVEELQLIRKNLSGTLSPDFHRFSYMRILDFMWNRITGNIPKELGDIKSLELLLLNGNLLTGPLPEELGYLSKLKRIQIDENYISGPIPKSYANLNSMKHFHMNNNSISGQIPPELSKLANIVHILLDNNNLSGYLPQELAGMPSLRILQLDNNNFDGTIPASYSNMSKLLKLSLRNCNLQGSVPDLSTIPTLVYLDLSRNQLNGSIPANKLSNNITTVDLSHNNLDGPIPANLTGLPRLQRLSLENNKLSGDVPSNIWLQRTLNAKEIILLDFQNNMLSDISDTLNPPANVSIRLQGNPVCAVTNQLNIVQLCSSQADSWDVSGSLTNSPKSCYTQSCPENYEYVKDAPVPCFCAAPLRIGLRYKSPGFSYFLPYESSFQGYLTSGINLNIYQLSIVSFIWEAGPRLRMYLKLFPEYNNHSNLFNGSEIRRLNSMFTGWTIPDNELFGPRELLNFTLLDPYHEYVLDSTKSGISKGALVGIALGIVVCAVAASVVIAVLIMRRHFKTQHTVSRKSRCEFYRLSESSIKVEGVKEFSLGEMALATQSFNITTLVGHGGYGNVYKGILDDGTTVAIKRALVGSLQGEKEFLTEIQLLSRVHHRNLVSLVGYCDEEGEQMLVYEFMPNGTLKDRLSAKSKEALSFAMRLRIALDSAKGVLYLHSEADPPIFHRDIKASNILLDSRFTAKVADFGISKLAPVPDIEGFVPGHVSTVVKGTPGYLDPEYFLTHKLTDKSDVYSLGIVFLELLTGMQPISHGKNIVREVNMAYQSGKIFSVIDERMGPYPSECVEKFVTVALKCCQDDTDARPSMAELVRELENIWFMMDESDSGTSKFAMIYTKSTDTPTYSSSSTRELDISSDFSRSNPVITELSSTFMPR